MLTDTTIQSILPAAHLIKKADGGGLNICVLPGGRRESGSPIASITSRRASPAATIR